MAREIECLGVGWFFFLLVFFALTALCNVYVYDWHDQQRLGQLFLMVGSLPILVFFKQKELSASVLVAMALIFLLGLCSSLQAEWPIWALKEWARYFGLVLLFVLLGGLFQAERTQCFVLLCVSIVGAVQALEFIVLYLSAFISGFRVLDANILFNGFSNPRFFGQFQVLLLPVLALFVGFFYRSKRIGLMCVFSMTMVVHWCIALMLGGRGLWVSLFVANVLLLVVFKKYWRIVFWQVVTALIGMFLFGVLFIGVPDWLGFSPVIYDGLRTDLSLRDIIWRRAWEMAISNPWLGIGPMHFAAEYNAVAAHPHQVILQWLSEWGAPATALAIWVGGLGMLKGAHVLRSDSSTEMDAGLWTALAGALVLAQVDGVFVMPYTETWIAILAGLAFSRWGVGSAGKIQRYALSVIVVPVVFVLAQVVINDVPGLPQVEQEYFDSKQVIWVPRFWTQGWIPM